MVVYPKLPKRISILLKNSLYSKIKPMRNYQLVLILRASLSQVNRKKAIETVKDYLKSAKIVKQDDLGEKDLAYPIKKESKGVYFSFLFEAESIEGLEKRLIGTEDILRHLLIRV